MRRSPESVSPTPGFAASPACPRRPPDGAIRPRDNKVADRAHRAHRFLVCDPVRLVRVGALPPLQVLDVRLVVPLGVSRVAGCWGSAGAKARMPSSESWQVAWLDLVTTGVACQACLDTKGAVMVPRPSCLETRHRPVTRHADSEMGIRGTWGFGFRTEVPSRCVGL
jgi:hypothetical protein